MLIDLGRNKSLIILLLFASFLSSECFAGNENSPQADQSIIKRNILVIYNDKQELIGHPEDTDVHRRAEMPLNHLGLILRYHPASKPLPSDSQMEDVRGILTWFRNIPPFTNMTTYCSWLNKQLDAGKKIVILGIPGFLPDESKDLAPACNEFLKNFGILFEGERTTNPYMVDKAVVDSNMVEFERPINKIEGVFYSKFTPTKNDLNVYLTETRKDLIDSESPLIFTSPRGGFAYEGNVMFFVNNIDQHQWKVNPFRFFREAFDVHNFPIPDTTTRNGNRIYFSHIDGDGIYNVSLIDRESWSGEVIFDEIIKPLNDLPITVSIISGYLDIKQYTGNRSDKMYKNIFSSPNVEPAIHGYAHPFLWREGKLALRVPGYKFNASSEIESGLSTMNDMLDKLNLKRKPEVFLWTGDCLVPPATILAAEKFKLLHMNGGDGRFDMRSPSYSFVSPIGVQKGGYWQVYSAVANENIFTNLWEGRFYGFSDAIQTFNNTESPIRVKPINIYYHFYSGERKSSLKALNDLYKYAREQEIIPMFASEYIKIARDFYDTTINQTSSGWVVNNSGDLTTFRFDNETRGVNLRESTGVLGFTHFQDNLYVTTDGSGEAHIVLSKVKNNIPYIDRATFDVKDWQVNAKTISFTKNGWMKCQITIGGMLPGAQYVIRAAQNEFILRANNNGFLNINFKMSENGTSPTPVKINKL